MLQKPALSRQNVLAHFKSTLAHFSYSDGSAFQRLRRDHRRWASLAIPDEKAIGERKQPPNFPHPSLVRDGELKF